MSYWGHFSVSVSEKFTYYYLDEHKTVGFI